MKLEYSNKLQVFEGSEIKCEDTNDFSDSTYTHRVAENADLAASASITITPANMTTINFIQVTDSSPADVPAKFNLILTDTGGAKTIVDLQRQFTAFGNWTAAQIVCQSTAMSVEWVLLGV